MIQEHRESVAIKKKVRENDCKNSNSNNGYMGEVDLHCKKIYKEDNF